VILPFIDRRQATKQQPVCPQSTISSCHNQHTHQELTPFSNKKTRPRTFCRKFIQKQPQLLKTRNPVQTIKTLPKIQTNFLKPKTLPQQPKNTPNHPLTSILMTNYKRLNTINKLYTSRVRIVPRRDNHLVS
jgi:ribosomal protein S18